MLSCYALLEMSCGLLAQLPRVKRTWGTWNIKWSTINKIRTIKYLLRPNDTIRGLMEYNKWEKSVTDFQRGGPRVVNFEKRASLMGETRMYTTLLLR